MCPNCARRRFCAILWATLVPSGSNFADSAKIWPNIPDIDQFWPKLGPSSTDLGSIGKCQIFARARPIWTPNKFGRIRAHRGHFRARQRHGTLPLFAQFWHTHAQVPLGGVVPKVYCAPPAPRPRGPPLSRPWPVRSALPVVRALARRVRGWAMWWCVWGGGGRGWPSPGGCRNGVSCAHAKLCRQRVHKWSTSAAEAASRPCGSLPLLAAYRRSHLWRRAS